MHSLAPRTPILRRVLSLAASAGLALAALLGLAASAQAAGRAAAAPAPDNLPSLTVIVTSNLDASDDNLTDHICHEASDNKCSLRAAVQQLDHDSGGIIALSPGGIYTLTNDADGDLQLQKDISIVGSTTQYSLIVGKPGWTHRLLRVQNGAHVTLSGLALSNGNVVTGTGGALDMASGTATLDHIFMEGNVALAGGAIYNRGVLEMNTVVLAANHAISDGAAIYNDATLLFGDNLTITLGNLVSNQAGVDGGALFNLGHARVLSSELSLNGAVNGGGVANLAPGSLLVESSSFWSNQSVSTGDGGGLFNNGLTALIQMANSSVVSNAAAIAGGGLANIRGDVTLDSDTVAGNTASEAVPAPGGSGGGLFNGLGKVHLANTLVADNVDKNHLAPDCGGPSTYDSLDYNLVYSTTNCTLTGVTAHNITGQDPLLGPFGFYGGQAMLPLTLHSPAVDAGHPAGCKFGIPTLLLDERGQPRTTDGNGDGVARCDIGAFELQLTRVFEPLVSR